MKILESPYARLTTENLWTLRGDMEHGIASTAVRFAEGKPMREGEVDMLQLRVTQVEAIDAVLLARGEKVPAPFWE